MVARGWMLYGMAACAGAPEATMAPLDPCEAEAEVDLGTGIDAFEPLEGGDALPVVHGPQGGYHVVVSLRATGIYGGDNAQDPESPVLHAWLEEDDVPVADLVRQRDLEPRDDALVLLGQLLIFTSNQRPELGDAALAWTVTDRCPRVFEGSREVVLVADPASW